MNFSLHLTDDCNMRCTYCTRHKQSISMSEETLTAACDLAFSKGNAAGLCFFGGEPLLKKELIYYALDYCKRKSAETGKKFRCKMTTNGTLLDDEFLDKAAGAGMVIGLSFDGLGQDICRRYKNGNGSFSDVEQKARLLLDKMPLSYAMLTIAPQAADSCFGSVKYLYELGFTKITCTIAYGKNVSWTDERLDVLKKQYEQTADYYADILLQGRYFFFSPFDSKISDCINGFNPSERCHLGFRQMPIAPDGKIYPCTQFIGDEAYCLGDVYSGISVEKQLELAKKASTPSTCTACELNKRCTNSCGCLNRLETGNENSVSPLQCSYERILIELSDKLAQRLYSADKALFMRKFAPKANSFA